jgi:hypothetical protein
MRTGYRWFQPISCINPRLSLLDIVLVPKEGFEPTHPCGHCALNAARLPFRHFGIDCYNVLLKWWAMRDSNPRPPRCKRGALAN